MSAMSDKQKTAYTPTGKWEVYGEYDSNYETHAPVLVGPDGEVHSRWSPDDIGSSMAHSYADTYNLNEDKAAEFRDCPYCTKGCSWCGRVTV